MKTTISRRSVVAWIASAPAWLLAAAKAQVTGGGRRGGQGGQRRPRREVYELPSDLAEFATLSLVLGRVTDRAVTVSAVSREAVEAYYEFGTVAGQYNHKTALTTIPAGVPVETILSNLHPNTAYFYRIQTRRMGSTEFGARTECRFQTQREPGTTWTFGIQGDSHPERPQMSDSTLYARTLQSAHAGMPDFYICMGDDFSIDTIATIDEASVNSRYLLQRPFLGLVGHSAPVFLMNGNHEQASLFNLNQTDVRHSATVLAQTARNRYFPTIAPDGFYSGNNEPMKSIGLLKDYYAWTWGDALFVVLDNYWHSPVLVDSGFQETGPGGGGGAGGGKRGDGSGGGREDGKVKGGGKGNRDLWNVTLGDAQYQWFRRTLEQSTVKYKFVFAHHVLGTERGGVDVCDLYEWGGHSKRGDYEFRERRPGWDLPIHQLMIKHGVTIYFQGHDHLFCRQERDGVIYQEVPMPGDPGYVAYNDDRYESGVKLPNSGHLRVTVSPEDVKVDYVRCYLPADETISQKSGAIAYSYSAKSRKSDT